MTNTFDNKVQILSEIWTQLRFDEQLTDFVEYSDLGLPLAYLFYHNIVEPTDTAKAIIQETYDVLLAMFEVEDSADFEWYADLYNKATEETE
jgi:hypothetical protein